MVLLLGLLLKLPCGSGDWSDGRPYRRFCYTDIVPLYRAELLAAGKFPYLQTPNEYPVGLGVLMGLTSLPVDTDGDFFLLNVLVLSLAAVITTVLLHRLVGARALFFAAAPTLLLYGFLNWDLVPVALATAGTFAYLRGRDRAGGALLGLGAAAKLFPGYLVVPFALGRERDQRRSQAIRLVVWAALVWMVANLPIAALRFDNWSEFFRFNAARVVDWGTVWFVGCHRITGKLNCPVTSVVNVLSAVGFVGGAVLLWRLKARRDPEFPRWTFGLPLLVLFLLTTKVYSPQYSLWLLPWFALVMPDLRLFLAFEATDVAVFVTEFSWLGRFTGFGGLPIGLLELAVVIRAAVLASVLFRYLAPSPERAVIPAGYRVPP